MPERFIHASDDVFLEAIGYDVRNEHRTLAAALGNLGMRVVKDINPYDDRRVMVLKDKATDAFIVLQEISSTHVRRLHGRLHVSFWCGDCESSFDVKSDIPPLDGTQCPFCNSHKTKLTSVDSADKSLD